MHSMPTYLMFYYSHRIYQQKCWEKANDCSGNLGCDKRMGMCLTVIYQLMKSCWKMYPVACSIIPAGSTNKNVGRKQMTAVEILAMPRGW
jgi:hypothetical protein